jgi:hypothetical protein
VAICGRRTKQNLTRTLSLKPRGRLDIYEIHCRGNRFTPEMSRDKRRDHKSTSCLNYMAMLTLGNTILSMSTRTRELRKGTLRRKKLTKRCREILPPESEQKTRIALEN